MTQNTHDSVAVLLLQRINAMRETYRMAGPLANSLEDAKARSFVDALEWVCTQVAALQGDRCKHGVWAADHCYQCASAIQAQQGAPQGGDCGEAGHDEGRCGNAGCINPQVPEQPADQGAVVHMREALRQCYVELHYCAQQLEDRKLKCPEGGSVRRALALGKAALANPLPVEAQREGKDVAWVATVYPDWTALQLIDSGALYAFNRATGRVYKSPHPDCPIVQFAPPSAAPAPSAPPVGVEGKIDALTRLADDVWYGRMTIEDAHKRVAEIITATPAVSAGDAKDGANG